MAKKQKHKRSAPHSVYKNYAEKIKDVALSKEEKDVPIPARFSARWQLDFPKIWDSIYKMSANGSSVFNLELEYAVKAIKKTITDQEPNRVYIIRKLNDTQGRIWRLEDKKRTRRKKQKKA